MKNRMSGVLWGLAFILVGIGFAGNTFNLWDFSLFFDGWWTLFIIVPCAISLFQNGPQTGSIVGLVIGVMLLLSAQDIIDRGLVWKLLLPVVFVLIGFRIIFSSTMQRSNRFSEHPPVQNEDGTVSNNYIAILSGREERIVGKFHGANAIAVLGGVDLNLRNAVIDQDVTITVTAVFGGVDLFVPSNVLVKVNATPIFGGVDNKAGDLPQDQPYPVVYVDALCIFGGVDIK